MKIKKTGMAFFVLLIMISTVALGGCQGGRGESKGDKAPVTDDNISSKEPKYGGSVVVGISQDLDSLDPHKAVAAGTKEVLFNVFEGLVKPNKDGDLVPAVASDYKMSEDGMSYSFTIREGILFHNNRPVTAEDVKFSIERRAGMLDETDSSIVVDTALLNIEQVNIVDEGTVEVKLKEPDSELLAFMTFAIIPKDYDNRATVPIGTGPFAFESYKVLESFKVKRFDGYYNPERPYLDEVTFKIMPNADTAMMELRGGTLDIFPYLTEDQALQLKDSFQIEYGNMNLVQGLFLNNDVEPFNDPLVRKALNYAVDKQGILDMVAGGKGNIIGSNMPHSYKNYYAEELESVYSYNPEEAKALLKEAGYEELKFTITVPSNYQYHVDTAQVLVEQLRESGIQAELKQVDWAGWLGDVYSDRHYQATIVGLDGNLAPRSVLERFESDSGKNFINYKNEEYDKVLNQAVKALDGEQKVKEYKELQALLTNDAASVYLQDPPLIVAVNKALSGYTFYPVYVQDMAEVYYTE